MFSIICSSFNVFIENIFFQNLIMYSIELPIAILSASLILSELVTPLQWLGIAMILVAIAFNELGTKLFRIR